jgi:hypothetical protein
MALLLRKPLRLRRLTVEDFPLSEGICSKLLRVVFLFVLDGLDGRRHGRERCLARGRRAVVWLLVWRGGVGGRLGHVFIFHLSDKDVTMERKPWIRLD